MTPPEKSRLEKADGRYVLKERIDPQAVLQGYAEFRRIPNLFEIVTFSYWQQNFHLQFSEKNRAWQQRYMSDKTGREHLLGVVNLKLRYSGLTEKEIKSIGEEKKLAMTDAFFGGSHELIISGKHFRDGAALSNELASAGQLSAEEHYQYMDYTINAIDDIYANNRYARYISIFQNWLREAGASFDHLHKQLVALDEWGTTIERQQEMVYKNPNLFNDYAANLALYHNLVICENDYAFAYADIGHNHPTVAIYSKSVHCSPLAHTAEERRGMSDIVHAIHAAMGAQLACNEEWYYMPRDAIFPMPWYILVKWRINIPAGFEGGTNIFVNPMSTGELKERIISRLFELRVAGHIGPTRIGEECLAKPNTLEYYKNFK
jgi:galactose-1-phosphate uridylyltransferase